MDDVVDAADCTRKSVLQPPYAERPFMLGQLFGTALLLLSTRTTFALG